MIAIVLALSFVLLLLAFRSLLVPLKAVVMNLLSIGAAFGIVTFVVQPRLVGDARRPRRRRSRSSRYVPLMMFAILFGLSMDYEVFLMTHVRERWQATGDPHRAGRRGPRRAPARVITSAALIMVSVFCAFILNGDPNIKQFGLGMAAAVAVDATVVRCLLVPAIMSLLGRRGLVAAAPGWTATCRTSASRARSTSRGATPPRPPRRRRPRRTSDRRSRWLGCDRARTLGPTPDQEGADDQDRRWRSPRRPRSGVRAVGLGWARGGADRKAPEAKTYRFTDRLRVRAADPRRRRCRVRDSGSARRRRPAGQAQRPQGHDDERTYYRGATATSRGSFTIGVPDAAGVAELTGQGRDTSGTGSSPGHRRPTRSPGPSTKTGVYKATLKGRGTIR